MLYLSIRAAHSTFVLYATVVVNRKMRATLPRLVRVVTRSQLAAENTSANIVQPVLPRMRPHHVEPSIIQSLLERKASMGGAYPSNIRIEPILTKATFEGVPAEARKELKELLKER